MKGKHDDEINDLQKLFAKKFTASERKELEDLLEKTFHGEVKYREEDFDITKLNDQGYYSDN